MNELETPKVIESICMCFNDDLWRRM